MSEDDGSIGLVDFSSVVVAIERNSNRERRNSSTASDITFDSICEMAESRSSAEQEDDSKYADYRRMLTASNRTKKSKKTPDPPDDIFGTIPFKGHPKVNRVFDKQPLHKNPSWSHRVHSAGVCVSFDKASNRPCHPTTAPNHVPFFDDSFETEPTASVASLGSGRFQWFARGKQKGEEEIKRKDQRHVAPKAHRKLRGGSFFERSHRRTVP